MFKKLCSLLLCVAMLACVLTACGETPAPTTTNDNSPPSQTNPPSDQQSPKKPTTPEEYISTAWEKMLVSDYQETEVRNKTMIMNGAESKYPTETSVYIGTGEYFRSEEDGFVYVFIDDVFYVSAPEAGIKNKYTVPESERDNPLLHPTGEETAWFQSVKFKSLTLGTDENGNVTITGKGTGAEAQAVLETLFGAMPGFAIDYDSLEWVLTVDSEYRFVSEEVHLDFVVSGGAGSLSATTTCSYLYGEQYAVTAPTDADSYTEVNSFDQLFT